MPYWSDYVFDTQGNIIPLATVSVTAADGTTPTLYSNALRTTTKTQPFQTNTSGFYEFYVAPGRYTILAQSGGFSQNKTVDLGIAGTETATDFGASGWSTEDNSTAIQAAITYLINRSPSGGCLMLPDPPEGA